MTRATLFSVQKGSLHVRPTRSRIDVSLWFWAALHPVDAAGLLLAKVQYQAPIISKTTIFIAPMTFSAASQFLSCLEQPCNSGLLVRLAAFNARKTPW